MTTMDELLKKLEEGGGAIVCTSALNHLEIALAQACGRMYVNDRGIGFVWLPQAYVNTKMKKQ